MRQQHRDLESELVWFVNRTDSTSDRVRLYATLEVSIAPGDPSEAEEIQFTWDVIDFNEKQLKIKIDFADPAEISADDRIDQI